MLKKMFRLIINLNKITSEIFPTDTARFNETVFDFFFS